jgi:hypothetical protein
MASLGLVGNAPLADYRNVILTQTRFMEAGQTGRGQLRAIANAVVVPHIRTIAAIQHICFMTASVSG